MSDDDTLTAAARARVHAAAAEWSPEDVRRLAALVNLGAPSHLHGDATGLPCERNTDPGDVSAARPVLSAIEHVRADALHTWREVGRIAGVPLPPPGRVR